MDILDEKLLHLWKLLGLNEVRYIMVGGFAVNLHGFQRFTGDIDLWIEDTTINRQKLRKAFADLDLGDFQAIETMPFIPGWTEFMLISGFSIDLMSSVKGLENLSFQECYDLSSISKIEGIQVPFLHINHLIQSKKAAARPKDLIDIEELEKILKLRNRLI